MECIKSIGPGSEASDIVSYGGYATISEINKTGGISDKKCARAQKRTHNNLSDKDLTSKILAEEAGMGFKPTLHSNPLSRFASTPPPTPATTQDGDDCELQLTKYNFFYKLIVDLPFLAIVENPYSMYSSINPEVIAKKHQARQMIILDTDAPLVTSQNFETPNLVRQRKTSPSEWSLEEVPRVAITSKVQIEEVLKKEKIQDIKLNLEVEKEGHLQVDSDVASTISTDNDEEALVIN